MERRRIAADLHDGTVQRLAGVSLSLAASANALGGAEDGGKAGSALTRAAAETRETIRELRTLLVDIYPPTLQRSGLLAAMNDLVAPLRAAGIAVTLDVPEDLQLPSGTEALLYRVAQEALRNARTHGEPTTWSSPSRCTPARRCSASRTTAVGSAPTTGMTAPRRPLRAAPDARPRRPCRRHPAGALIPGAWDPRPPGGAADVIRLLIADDHPLVRDALANLLAGAEDIDVVGVTADGREAVSVALETDPDVVLMDLEMPELNGIDATRALHEAGSAARVVVLTTFSDRDRILGALDAGALGYLLKDAEPEEIIRGVRAAARGGVPAGAPCGARADHRAQRGTGTPEPELSAREQEVLAASSPRACPTSSSPAGSRSPRRR